MNMPMLPLQEPLRRRGAAVAVVVLCGVLLLLLGRGLLLSRLQAELAAHLAEEYGLALSVEEIGGSLLSDLSLRNVRARRLHEGALIAELDIRSLQIRYSLLDLLRDRDAFLARMRIEAAGGAVLLDLAGSLSPGADEEDAWEMPAVLPLLAIEGFDLVLVHGARPLATCAGSRLVLGAAEPGRGRPLHLESAGVRFQVLGEARPSPLRLDLVYRPDTLLLQGLEFAGRAWDAEGRLGFPTASEPLSFKARLGALAGEIHAGGTVGEEEVAATLRLENLDLAGVADLLLPAGHGLEGRITAALAGRFAPEAPARAEATLEVSGEGKFRGHESRAVLRASLAGEELRVASFAGELAGNRLELREGAVSLPALRSWPSLAFADLRLARFSLRARNLPFLWRLAGRPAADLPLLPPDHTLVLAGGIREGLLIVESGGFTSRQNELRIERASLGLPRAGESFLRQPLQAALTVSLGDLGGIAALFGIAETAGSVQGRLAVEGSLARPGGLFSLQGRNLRHRQWTLADLRVEARADRERLRLLAAEARQEGDYLRLRGVWSLVAGKVEEVEGELRIADIGAYASLWPPLGPDAAGKLELRLSGGEEGGYRLRAGLQEARLAGLSFVSGRLEMITDLRRFQVDRLALAFGREDLELAGILHWEKAKQTAMLRLQRLDLSRAALALALQKEAAVTISYGPEPSLTIEDSLLLAGRPGSLALAGRLALHGENRLRVTARGVAGNGWLEELAGPGWSLQGFDLELHLQGSLADPRISLAATVASLAFPFPVEPMRGRVEMSFAGERLRITAFDWSNSRGQKIVLAGTMPLSPFAAELLPPGPLAVSASLSLPELRSLAHILPGEERLGGDLSAEMTLAGSWKQPVGRLRLALQNLGLPAFRGHVLPEPVTAGCEAVLEPGRLLLRECRAHSSSLAVKASGQWRDLPGAAALLAALRDFGPLPGRIAGQGEARIADLSWLLGQFPSLRRLGGGMEGVFTVAGTPSHPEFSGSLQIRDGTLRFNDPNIPALDGLNGRAEYAADRIRIEDLQGLLGGGPFQARGTVTGITGEEPRLDVTVQGENILLFRDADLRVRGNGALRLQGPMAALDLSGTLALREGRYTKNFDFLRLLRGTARPRSDIGLQAFSLPDPPLRDMRLRIAVGSLEPFQIRTNLARGAVRPQLAVAGTGEAPVLVGRIYVDPVRISLPAGTLLIESGIITFPENDPDRPTFDLAGRSRLAGYDISLRFQGTAEEPVITLSSQPPLPDDDLLLLVLTGRPPQDPRGAGRRSLAGMNMAVYLGRGLLASWFGNGSADADESLLERFEIEIGRQITSRGEGTVEAQFRLLEGVFLPGDRLYITSEKDVFDSFNIGVKLVFRFR